MPGLGARLLVYGFIGAFGLVGVAGLVLATQQVLESASFLHSAMHVPGTITELRPVRNTRHYAGTVIPVFRFSTGDGLNYQGTSAIPVRASAYRVNDRVQILYLPGRPDTARLDRFGVLWTSSLVFGIVGAAFTGVFGLALFGIWRTRRRPPPERATPDGPIVRIKRQAF
jgi:hypothetical protein